MLLSDGCIEDMDSLLQTTIVNNLSTIVGYDVDGNPLKTVKVMEKKLRNADNLLYSIFHDLSVFFKYKTEYEVETGALFFKYFCEYYIHKCIYDLSCTCIYTNISLYYMFILCIYSYVSLYTYESIVHATLVLRGQAWGAHVNEPWR
jgi:hypothetical protein